MSNTPTEDRLAELLLRWDELRWEGRSLAPEELCNDCPELAVELRRRIEAVRGMNSVLDIEPTQPAPPPEDRVSSATTRGHAIPHLLRSSAAYRPERRHAQGGLGEVFSARQEELDREVALKRIRPDKLHDAARRRFLREAAITARLQHPGIIPIYSLGHDDGGPFYTMPFIHGQTLHEAIGDFHKDVALRLDAGRRSLKVRGLLQHLITACNTVAYAHDQGVVHRDLKPSNIMLGPYGETLVVDWGLAKRFLAGEPAAEPNEDASSPSPSPDHLTATGAVMGTPRYMSPEQAKGEPSTPASDVFSLGVILYAILTGKPAFDEASLRSADPLKAVREGAVVPPRKRDASLPRALEAVCLKALAARAFDRYPSARDLGIELEKWLADEPVTAYAEPLPARLRRWVRRHRSVVQSAIAVLAFVAMSSTVAALWVDRARRGERSAKSEAQTNLKMAIETADRERAARSEAEANFTMARDAVDRFYTRIGSETLLNQPNMERLRKDLLGAARDYYQKFVDQRGGEPRVHFDLAMAYAKLAQILSDLGEGKTAIDHAKRTTDIFAGLTAARPEVQEYRRRLAASHNQLGILHQVNGRTAEAEEAYKAASGIARKLVEEHPGVREFARELANSQSNLGTLYTCIGRPELAEQSHLAALAVYRRLAIAHPEFAEYQCDLAASYNNRGFLYQRSHGRQVEAEQSYQSALALWRTVADAHPEVTQYQLEMARCYLNVGSLCSQFPSGRTSDAVQYYTTAAAILRKLAGAHPGVSEYQRLLSATQMNLGNVYGAAGRTTEAEQAHLAARTIFEKLAAAEPAVTELQGQLAMSNKNLGVLYFETGRLREGQQSTLAAIAILKKLAAAHPDQAEYALELVGGYCNMALQSDNGGAAQSSLDWYDLAITTLKDVRRRQPSYARARFYLGQAHTGRATALQNMGRFAQSIVDWDAAIEMEDGTQRNLMRLYRAMALARLGNYSRALADGEELAHAVSIPSADRNYNLACLFALTSVAVSQDPSYRGSDRARRAEQLAARAIEHLALARADGYFHKPSSVADLLKDTDLHLLGARPDFQRFLMDLAFPDNPFAP